jgi:hypothetical protein
MKRKLYSSGQSEKLCLTVHLSDPRKKTTSHLKSLNTHTHTQKDGDGKIYLKKPKYVYIQDIKLTLTYVMCELHIEKFTMPENGIYCVIDGEYQSSRLLCMGNILI